MKQHRGYIGVTSEPGHGSTFGVYLPRVEAKATAERVGPREPLRPGGRETVLFVEDEVALRDLMHRVLTKGGYTVLVAGDGLEALALVEEHAQPIDLVVTDVIMPRMSGPELASRLRARDPGIRLLYVSGYTADQLRSAQTNLGADATLLAEAVHLGRAPPEGPGSPRSPPPPDRALTPRPAPPDAVRACSLSPAGVVRVRAGSRRSGGLRHVCREAT